MYLMKTNENKLILEKLLNVGVVHGIKVLAAHISIVPLIACWFHGQTWKKFGQLARIFRMDISNFQKLGFCQNT